MTILFAAGQQMMLNNMAASRTCRPPEEPGWLNMLMALIVGLAIACGLFAIYHDH